MLPAGEGTTTRPTTGPLNKYDPAKTQAPKSRTEELKADIKKADKNHDGVVKGDELKSKAGQQLPDLNGDGKFDWDEGLKSMTFKGRDRNKDGVLSGDETKGLDTSKYKQDADGNVTQEGFMKARRQENMDRRDQRRAAEFGELDKNHDGRLSGTELKKVKGLDKTAIDTEDGLSLDEYGQNESMNNQMDRQDEANKAFDKADKNHDGVLTGSETKGYEKYDQSATQVTANNGQVERWEFTTGADAERKQEYRDSLLNGPSAPPPKGDKDDKKPKKKD